MRSDHCLTRQRGERDLVRQALVDGVEHERARGDRNVHTGRAGDPRFVCRRRRGSDVADYSFVGHDIAVRREDDGEGWVVEVAGALQSGS